MFVSYASRAYFTAPMRMIVVPHTGHLPFIAGLPFFNFTAAGSFISRLALHFTQYAWTMRIHRAPQRFTPDKDVAPEMGDPWNRFHNTFIVMYGYNSLRI